MSTRFSLQPSSARPPKSSGPRSWPCIQVPNAPSKTSTRSLQRRRGTDDCAPLPTGARVAAGIDHRSRLGGEERAPESVNSARPTPPASITIETSASRRRQGSRRSARGSRVRRAAARTGCRRRRRRARRRPRRRSWTRPTSTASAARRSPSRRRASSAPRPSCSSASATQDDVDADAMRRAGAALAEARRQGRDASRPRCSKPRPTSLATDVAAQALAEGVAARQLPVPQVQGRRDSASKLSRVVRARPSEREGARPRIERGAAHRRRR